MESYEQRTARMNQMMNQAASGNAPSGGSTRWPFGPDREEEDRIIKGQQAFLSFVSGGE